MRVLTSSEFTHQYKPCDPIRAYLTLSESLKDAWDWCIFPEWMLMGLREVGFNHRYPLLLMLYGMVETLQSDMRPDDQSKLEQVKAFLIYGDMVSDATAMEAILQLNKFTVRLHRVINKPQMVARALHNLIYLCGVQNVTRPHYLLIMEICADVTMALHDDPDQTKHTTIYLGIKTRLSGIIRRHVHWDELLPFVSQ